MKNILFLPHSPSLSLIHFPCTQALISYNLPILPTPTPNPLSSYFILSHPLFPFTFILAHTSLPTCTCTFIISHTVPVPCTFFSSHPLPMSLILSYIVYLHIHLIPSCECLCTHAPSSPLVDILVLMHLTLTHRLPCPHAPSSLLVELPVPVHLIPSCRPPCTLILSRRPPCPQVLSSPLVDLFVSMYPHRLS